MYFSCHTWAFHDLTLVEALGTIGRLGFRYADIGTGAGFPTNRAVAQPKRAAAEIRDELVINNLQLADLYLMLPRISSDDEERQRKDLDLFKALLPFAAELKAPGITVSPGVIAEDENAFERTAEALREMITAAKAVQIPLSIEPHLDSMAATPAEALKLLDSVPGLRITIDWAQMVCLNIQHEEILRLLPHARHIQIRQAAKNQLQTPWEKGKIDVARVVADLINGGYSSAVCVEMMNIPGKHGMQKVDFLRESARMRDTLREARDRILKEREKEKSK